MINSEYKI